jgi:3'(2'), 5'-bisphosphate nucleotidase
MASRLLDHPAALCNIARRIAVEAGHLALDHFDESGGMQAESKSDGSPVTIADRAVEQLIAARLLAALPEVPVIGEEAVAGGTSQSSAGQALYWLVDPIDGTREFIEGGADWTINIALVRDGAPVLGVVFAPVPGELYAGWGPDTALRWSEDKDQEKPIHVRRLPASGLTVLASRHHDESSRLDAYLAGQKIARVTHRASSLKLCLVAAGKADLYPRFGPTSWWDTAAGDAVLRSAGGGIVAMEGMKPLRYEGPDFINPSFIAASLEYLALAADSYSIS